MKKIAVSSALCALLTLPSVGLGMKIYDGDDKSLDFYGSVRGFVGGGATVGNADFSGTATQPTAGTGTYLVGLQNNTHVGFNFKSGNVSGKIEIGVREGGALGSAGGNDAGFRYFYGTYDFGGAGKLSFGKMGTTTAEGGFTSDFNNNNSAGQGFGSVTQASRHLQLQYQIGPVNIAVIQDNTDVGNGVAYPSGTRSYSANPRFAVAYQPKIENLKLKIAATIKQYGKTNIGGGAYGNATAWHILAGVRPTFGKSHLSFFINYGINGHLYGEQGTNASDGQYGYTSLNALTGVDTKRLGVALEYGLGLGDSTKLIIGAGYQIAYGGIAQNAANEFANADINSVKVFLQLPYKPSKEFTIAPQISYMDTAVTQWAQATYHRAGAVGMVRLMYDF